MGRFAGRFAGGIRDAGTGLGLLASLPRFVRRPMTTEAARAAVRAGLATRGPRFLALIRQAVYGRPDSPYRWLLGLAGCEAGDLERLVRAEGVEGTLAALYRRGVYLTVDELKGRCPVVRGASSRWVERDALRTPGTAGLYAQTSGSRGQGTPVFHDLRFIRESALSRCVALDARGGLGWTFGHWGVPGSTTLLHVLEFLALGVVPRAWFWQVNPSAPGLPPRYRWSASVIRAGARLGGIALPRPRHVPVDDPAVIAEWMRSVLHAGGTPHLVTFASLAVRVCEAAREGGIDLGGAQFTVGGEAFTPRRRAAIQAAGAVAVPRYAAVECGPIAVGCVAPDVADAVHVVSDLFGMIQAGADGTLPPRAILLTSLSSTAPLVLLNVSLGDQAVAPGQPCGCSLEGLWPMRLHTIRSFEKLTAGGMTLHDADVVRILEEVLPARFGGTPADYQVVEAEGGEGQPTVTVLVHPRLGPLDAASVVDAFLGALGEGSGTGRVLSLQWRAAGVVRVERAVPRVTESGKLLHVRRPDGRAAP